MNSDVIMGKTTKPGNKTGFWWFISVSDSTENRIVQQQKKGECLGTDGPLGLFTALIGPQGSGSRRGRVPEG